MYDTPKRHIQTVLKSTAGPVLSNPAFNGHCAATMASAATVMNTPDIMRHVFQYLGAWDLWYCGQVSQKWRTVATAESLWVTFPEGLAVKDSLAEHKGCTLRSCWMRRHWAHLCPVCDVRQASGFGHDTKCDECALDHVRVAVHKARDARLEVEDVQGRRRTLERAFAEHGRRLLAPSKAGYIREDTIEFLLNHIADEYIGDGGGYANSNDRLAREQARDAVPEDIDMILRELQWLVKKNPDLENAYTRTWHDIARAQSAPWDIAQMAYEYTRMHIAQAVVLEAHRQRKHPATPVDLDVPCDTQLWACVLDVILEECVYKQKSCAQ